MDTSKFYEEKKKKVYLGRFTGVSRAYNEKGVFSEYIFMFVKPDGKPRVFAVKPKKLPADFDMENPIVPPGVVEIALNKELPMPSDNLMNKNKFYKINKRAGTYLGRFTDINRAYTEKGDFYGYIYVFEKADGKPRVFAVKPKKLPADFDIGKPIVPPGIKETAMEGGESINTRKSRKSRTNMTRRNN